MNAQATQAVAPVNNPALPEPVARRGLDEAAWRTLKNSLFPGASSDSVLMVVDYCKARKLDPLKKPCHIVPLRVKNAQTGNYETRDVVMPGIYELRTTAMRTGLYLGHSKPEYGPETEYLGVKAPEWCDITIYRWNDRAQVRTEFPVRVLFRECAATTTNYKQGTVTVNDKWSKSPVQMMTKCCEAAGLREAFPDELGGEMTADEMYGREIDITPRQSEPPKPRKLPGSVALDVFAAQPEPNPDPPAATAAKENDGDSPEAEGAA